MIYLGKTTTEMNFTNRQNWTTTKKALQDLNNLEKTFLDQKHKQMNFLNPNVFED